MRRRAISSPVLSTCCAEKCFYTASVGFSQSWQAAIGQFYAGLSGCFGLWIQPVTMGSATTVRFYVATQTSKLDLRFYTIWAKSYLSALPKQSQTLHLLQLGLMCLRNPGRFKQRDRHRHATKAMIPCHLPLQFCSGHQLFNVSQEAILVSLIFLAGVFEFGEGLLHGA